MEKLKAMAVAAAMATCATGWGATSYMFDNPENQAYFGARVAMDISSAANGGGSYSNQAGVSLGAVYNIPIMMNLYFEPGLSLFYNSFGTATWKNYELDPVYDENGNDITPEVLYQVDGNIRNFGFRIPLNIGYHFDFAEDLKVSVFTGPQLNASVTARYHQNAIHVKNHEEDAFSYSLFGTQGFKHFDLQWGFGAGITYQSYYLGFSGAWGITHMKSATSQLKHDLRRNIFSVTLGYNF
jgi:hypothetical protein